MSDRPSPRSISRFLVPTTLAALLLGALPAVAGAASRTATVTILHGLPRFTADVYVNDALTLDGFEPETLTEPLQLDPGTYDVAIRDVGAPADSEPAVQGQLTLEAGKNYSAIAHLDTAGTPGLSVFRNDLSGVAAGRARLVVRNTSDVESVTLRLDGRAVATGVGSGRGSTSTRAPGTYTVGVRSDDGQTLLSDETLRIREGTQVAVYLVGSAAEGTLALMIQEFEDLASSPGQVLTGSGDFAAEPGFPVWAMALMSVAGLSGCLVLLSMWRGRRPAVASVADRRIRP